MLYYVNTPDSAFVAVAVASDEFATTLAVGKEYEFISTVACWIKQGNITLVEEVETPPAAEVGADGSKFCGANQVVILNGGHGDTLAVLKHTGASDGLATLTPITVVR